MEHKQSNLPIYGMIVINMIEIEVSNEKIWIEEGVTYKENDSEAEI